MNETITVPMVQQRDINTVTTEIRTLINAAQRMALEYAIEVGRRLCEAKAMLNHGEWGTWLKEEVEFSQSSANNFMRIFEEYGADQITLDGAVAKSQTFGNLSYSKALRLLAIPAEEREEFVQENNVEHMSTRELDQMIRERDEAVRRAEFAEASAKEAQEASEKQLGELKKAAKKAKEKEKEVKLKLKQLQENPVISPEVMEKVKAEADEAAENRLRIERERIQAVADHAEEQTREAEARAEVLRKQLAAASPEMTSFKILFSSIQEDFNKLHELIIKITAEDIEQGKKLRAALSAMLEQCSLWVDKHD